MRGGYALWARRGLERWVVWAGVEGKMLAMAVRAARVGGGVDVASPIEGRRGASVAGVAEEAVGAEAGGGGVGGEVGEGVGEGGGVEFMAGGLVALAGLPHAESLIGAAVCGDDGVAEGAGGDGDPAVGAGRRGSVREDEVGVQGRRMGEAGLGERRWWVEVGWGGCRGGLLGRRGDEGGRGGGERVGGGEGEKEARRGTWGRRVG